MSRLDQLLARIDTTLTECDATTLPPLEPVDEQALAELLATHEQAPYWDRPILATEPRTKGTRRTERTTPWWRRRR